ncbi:hypothetical protein DFH06DRAFT_1125190 [Mycena polygramma]|nr:hypothetical protein DFH06DRAFT_1125190 [Mycena polygramma]
MADSPPGCIPYTIISFQELKYSTPGLVPDSAWICVATGARIDPLLPIGHRLSGTAAGSAAVDAVAANVFNITLSKLAEAEKKKLYFTFTSSLALVTPSLLSPSPLTPVAKSKHNPTHHRPNERDNRSEQDAVQVVAEERRGAVWLGFEEKQRGEEGGNKGREETGRGGEGSRRRCKAGTVRGGEGAERRRRAERGTGRREGRGGSSDACSNYASFKLFQSFIGTQRPGSM